MKCSILTIIKGRKPQLLNQRKGLIQSNIPPDEWIIVSMNEDPVEIEECPFPVRTERVDTSREADLPLALSRNHAARLAEHPLLIFLDVDCIPSPKLIDHYQQAMSASQQLWMGSIGYLSAGAANGDWTFRGLSDDATTHPLQPQLENSYFRQSLRYELFWSLNFAITQTHFETMGGFDESFSGYGAEDTDFSFTARKQGIPFGFVNAKAFHQHHPVCRPPLNHFEPILKNAAQFRKKWGLWPMDKWLREFAERGLIEFDQNRKTLAILRYPTRQEVEAATVATPAGF